MKLFVWGVLAMACLVCALFFLRYWRSNHDRLFGFFSLAFGLMSLQWTISALEGIDEMNHFYPLLLRILAFVAIIIAVLDKNHRERRRAGTPR